MSGSSISRLRRAALQALTIQGMLIALAALAILVSGAAMQALAVLLGGGISLLPNLWFALRVLGLSAPLHTTQRIGSLYKAEVIKLMLVVVLFMLVFAVWRSVPAATVLVTFVLAHPLYLILQAWLLARLEQQQQAS
jgi:ATP synthase protein I